MNKKIFLTLTFLLLCGSVSIFSQEWEYSLDYADSDDKRFYVVDAIELSDGNIAVASKYHFRSGYGDFYSCHPAILLLSSDGEEIARNVFFREGYCTMSYTPYLFENEGSLYALMTYNPDHDYTYFNHFMNYDNPPTDAIVGLYKLDSELNIEESYKYSYPIDTTECRDCQDWGINPNEISGNIYMFSAIEDDGEIIAVYSKPDSYKKNSAEAILGDSLVFMRMNYDGEIINRKAYLGRYSQGNYHYSYRRNHLVKTDLHYILYELNTYVTDIDVEDGAASYFDKDFNLIKTKNIVQPDFNHIYWSGLENISVIRSTHNTTYLATTARTIDPEYAHTYSYEDNRLYEFDDNIDNAGNNISILNYIVRGTNETRDYQAIMKAVDIAKDSSIYYAYNMNIGMYNDEDSWIVLERLNSDMDTIATLFYGSDNDNAHAEVDAIKATKDGGLIIVCDKQEAFSDSQAISKKVIKFPASAFGFDDVSIEEAHAHNLKVAVAYPNPGCDVMNIRTSLRDCTLQVYDMQGRIVHQQEITDDVTSVDASNWPCGTYIWELKTENGKLKVEEGKWVK